ncbi:unnamed protein product [Brugia timori]|uniref:Collagen-like protein n=1 Tax=Brugia timori TaxID=42155 RepID=A0A0R3Q448_9BILA|nr:unnamed protein product [Brugia timori]
MNALDSAILLVTNPINDNGNGIGPRTGGPPTGVIMGGLGPLTA